MIPKKKDLEELSRRLERLEASYQAILRELRSIEAAVAELQKKPQPGSSRKSQRDLEPLDRPRYVDI